MGCKPAETPVPEPQPQPVGSLSIKLQHYWENPATTFYPETWYTHTTTADSFLFNRLRYYLSGFYLLSPNGDKVVLPATERLIAANGGVFSVDLPAIPHGEYAGIGFYLGVDSARNYGGVFGGELHPDYGMYRNPREGFHFLWAAGLTPSAPNDSFEYRLYGFDAVHQVYRNTEVLFGQERLHIDGDHQPELGLYVNTAAFWGANGGPAHRHIVLSPGAEAADLSARFMTAFSFEHIHQ